MNLFIESSVKRGLTRKKLSSKGLSGLFEFYMKFGHFFWVVPFKIHSSGPDYICVGPSKIRWVLNLSVHAVMWLSIFLRLNSRRHKKVELGHISEKVGEFVFYSWLMYDIVLYWTLCRHKNKFVVILNHVKRLWSDMDNFGMELPGKFTLTGLILFSVGYTIIPTILEFLFIDQQLHNYPMGQVIQTALDKSQRVWGQLLSVELLSLNCQYILATVQVLSEVFGIIVTHFADHLCLTSAIVLYLLTNSLVCHLANQNVIRQEQEKIIDICCDLLELADLIEETIGSLIFCCCFTLLPYYSFSMKGFFQGDSGVRLNFFLYAFIFVCVLWTAAETNAMMNSVGRWFRNQGESRKRDEYFGRKSGDYFEKDERISIILIQISNNCFGLKGRAFTITYGFVGSITSLIITYSVIIVQFESL